MCKTYSYIHKCETNYLRLKHHIVYIYVYISSMCISHAYTPYVYISCYPILNLTPTTTLKTPRCVCILHCTNRAVAQWVCHWPTCPGQVTCDDWHFGKRDDMKVAIILILKKVNICWCQNRWTSKIWSIYISIIYSNKSMRYCRQGSLIWKEKTHDEHTVAIMQKAPGWRRNASTRAKANLKGQFVFAGLLEDLKRSLNEHDLNEGDLSEHHLGLHSQILCTWRIRAIKNHKQLFYGFIPPSLAVKGTPVG